MQEKTILLEKIFSIDKSEKEIYNEIISFSKRANPFPKESLLKENLVSGCQSELYLTHAYKDGKIHFYIQTEALISKGLATILTFLYSDEAPEAIFKQPPEILKKIRLLEKVSLSRQVGIANLLQKMTLICAKYI
jgi:sulfur transfer protein SufE